MTTTALDLQVQRDAQADALAKSIRGKVCATCDGYPFVAWVKGEWVLRCNCWPKPPVLASEYERTVGRRVRQLEAKERDHDDQSKDLP